MNSVTVSELLANGDEVIDRVMLGESVLVIRDGREVAELRPLPRRPIDGATLLQRWTRLPHVEPAQLADDIGAVLDVFL